MESKNLYLHLVHLTVCAALLLQIFAPYEVAYALPQQNTTGNGVRKAGADAPRLDLANMVGTRVTLQGRLKQFPSGRIGIVVNEPHGEQISIDALPITKNGELPVQLLVEEHDQSVKHPKYRKRGKRRWLETNLRLKKLDQIIEQYHAGDLIDLTGTLCHLTASIRGRVSPHVHYPKLPDSHYFFSVDDLIVTLKK